MSSNPFTPPQSPSGETVFDPEDAVEMNQFGLITPPSSDGMVRVSKRRLREHSSSDDSAVSAGSITATSPNTSLPSPTDMTSIPFLINSSAYYVWLGFTAERAYHLNRDWTLSQQPGLPEDAPTGLDLAKDWLKRSNVDAGGRSEDWHGAMQQMDINQDLQQAIMDPQHNLIRLTQSLKYWIIDTLEMRQRALASIQVQSRERQHERQNKKQRSSQPSSSAAASSSAASPNQPNIGSLSIQPNILPGHTLLWKGLDVARTYSLLKPNGDLNNLHAIISQPPGDFSGWLQLWYFTENKEIAELYSWFALRRLNRNDSNGNVCLVAVQVPNTLLSTVTPRVQLLFPSNDWKQAVYEGRKGQLYSPNIDHLDRANLITGHICGNDNDMVSRLSNFTQITQGNVLRIPNTPTPARQFAFSPFMRIQLTQALKRTVTLHRSEHSR